MLREYFLFGMLSFHVVLYLMQECPCLVEEPWHIEDCACMQAKPTLQEYEIPVI